MEPLLKDVTQRTLLFVGDGDLLIPSKEEGPRLKERMPRCRLRVSFSARYCSQGKKIA